MLPESGPRDSRNIAKKLWTKFHVVSSEKSFHRKCRGHFRVQRAKTVVLMLWIASRRRRRSRWQKRHQGMCVCVDAVCDGFENVRVQQSFEWCQDIPLDFAASTEHNSRSRLFFFNIFICHSDSSDSFYLISSIYLMEIMTVRCVCAVRCVHACHVAKP